MLRIFKMFHGLTNNPVYFTNYLVGLLYIINHRCLSSPFNVILRSFIRSHKKFRPFAAGHFHISLTHSKVFDEALLSECLGINFESFVSSFPVCDLWTKILFPACSFCHKFIPRKLFMLNNYSLLQNIFYKHHRLANYINIREISIKITAAYIML